MGVEYETKRLIIRQLQPDDAPFIVRLLNDESFIRYIGDKNVQTEDDAVDYLLNGPIQSYEKNGFGLKLVQLKEVGESIGMCGLLKRDELNAPDLGYALLPEFRGKGFALEAARAIVEEECSAYGIDTVLAVTRPDNHRSSKLLSELGFDYKRLRDFNGSENRLYEYTRSR